MRQNRRPTHRDTARQALGRIRSRTQEPHRCRRGRLPRRPARRCAWRSGRPRPEFSLRQEQWRPLLVRSQHIPATLVTQGEVSATKASNSKIVKPGMAYFFYFYPSNNDRTSAEAPVASRGKEENTLRTTPGQAVTSRNHINNKRERERKRNTLRQLENEAPGKKRPAPAGEASPRMLPLVKPTDAHLKCLLAVRESRENSVQRRRAAAYADE